MESEETNAKIVLPKPPKEPLTATNWQPKTSFWLTLTGHQQPFTIQNINNFFSENGRFTLPKIELKWHDNKNPIEYLIVDQDPNIILHPSFLGVMDSLRMYAGNGEFLKEMQEKLREQIQTKGSITSEYKPKYTPRQIIQLPFDMGFVVQVDMPGFEKKERRKLLGFIKKTVLEKKDSSVPGYVFFIDSSKVQTPLDALRLADEIAKLHPETAKDLYTRYLTAAVVGRHNASVWEEVLASYSEDEIPDYLKPQLDQIKSYVSNMVKEFNQLVDACGKRLNCTPLTEESIKDLVEEYTKKPRQDQTEESEKDQRLPFGLQDKDRVERHVENFVKIAKRIYEKEYESKEEKDHQLEKVKQRIQTIFEQEQQATSQTIPLFEKLSERLSSDPKEWLMQEALERGQEILLDRLRPSKSMLVALYIKRPDLFEDLPAEVKQSIDGWLNKRHITDLEKFLKYLEDNGSFNEDYINKKSLPNEIYNLIHYLKKRRGLKEDDPYGVRLWLEDMGIKDEMDKLWQTEDKKKIAQKQRELTDLILLTQNKFYPGGYYGWNEKVKKDLQPLFETSPYLIFLFEEANCVGRTILVSGLLTKANIFNEQDLRVLSTYNHAFLAAIDAKGKGRIIEPSGLLEHSYDLNIPQDQTFEGKVDENQAIIYQLPLKTGLLVEIGRNYSNKLDYVNSLKIRSNILELSGFSDESFWYNLSVSLKNIQTNSLDWILAESQAGFINDKFPFSFYYLLLLRFNNVQSQLQNASSIELPLLPYIKLNLLAMKRTLKDENKAQELKRRIEDEFKVKVDINNMLTNLNQLLKTIETCQKELSATSQGTQLPFGLPDDYEEWPEYIRRNPGRFGLNQEEVKTINDEEILCRGLFWNTSLYPKPQIDEKGNVTWILPEQK